MKRVAVLRGGPSTEYEVSMQTAKGVIDALLKNNYFVKPVTITKQEEWLVDGYIKDPQRALIDIDVVFIAMHGNYGEDGTVQRVLDRLGIPYTGSGAYASAIAFNKQLTKDHLHQLNIKTPRHVRVERTTINKPNQTAFGINQLLGDQCFIKPQTGGSSVDTRRTQTTADLTAAINNLLQKYEVLLVEEAITGREATVGVLEQFRDQQHYVLPAIEIIPPTSAKFFSAEVKYTGETEEICPGRFSDSEKKQLLETASKVHQALNLSQYSRSDFIVASDGIYFLEVNPRPALIKNTTFLYSLEAIGSSYEELVSHLVETARVG